MTTSTTYTITFGLFCPGGSPITEDEWNLFLTSEVCPLLKSFSVRDELGFWNGEPEPCRVLTFVSHSFDDGLAIQAIARAYKTQFDQDAVMINSHTSFAEVV